MLVNEWSGYFMISLSAMIFCSSWKMTSLTKTTRGRGCWLGRRGTFLSDEGVRLVVRVVRISQSPIWSELELEELVAVLALVPYTVESVCARGLLVSDVEVFFLLHCCFFNLFLN